MSILTAMELLTNINILSDSKMKKIAIAIIVGVIASFASCNKQPIESESEHDHDHEEVKVLITGYSNEFELFAEADPFVVNKTSSILVHLTHLGNFKPLKEGKVTLSLIVGTNGIRQVVEKSVRPGIYLFNLTPVAAGNARILVDVDFDGVNYQIEVKGIGVFADEHSAIHDAEARAPQEINTVGFTKEQSWKIEFATEHPKLEPFGHVIKTVAQVRPSQVDENIITAKANGIVAIVDEGIIQGKVVNSGQKMLLISGSGLAENSWNVRFSEAKNNFEKTKADFERISKLAKEKIVPEKDLIVAQNDYANAKALFENISKHFSADGQQVIAPYNGFVKEVFIQNGQYVEIGQPLLSIARNRSLLIEAEVHQKYFPFLGNISSASFKTIYDGNTYSLDQLNGKIVSYGKSVNPDNFLIPIVLQIDNKIDIIPGGFVEIYLKALSDSNVVTIPSSAILEEQGYFFVFVQVTPELFEKREVKIGATDGFRTEIVVGLTPSDRIVSKGSMLVKLAQAAAALDPHSGHVH